ncbi:glycosyltransferase [candidate division KSB3 bacterium]|uniref:Glycosyltransferase n=1 Tax=candidate division KSB3 bacterium TaxID=2044937 RepID=A0A9D5JWG5_9BACT|nr:glycosyltransferase [candidate division KSB3 bacterium]MBD3325385.1 glycosyltransferase [candidate division KSB3 bacterium]
MGQGNVGSMKHAVKVLHITKMKGISGSENHLLDLLTGLNKHEFSVHLGILAETAHIPALQTYTQRLEQSGVTVRFFPMRKYADASLLWRLRAYIAQERFDLIHTHLIHADLYGTLAAKLAGSPAILSSRHNDDRFRNHPLFIRLNRLLARCHARVIVISDWIGTFIEDVEGIPPEKIVRIQYGLDAATVIPYADPGYVRQELDLPEAAPVIGTIGRLTAQKGHTYLLQAIKQVQPHVPDIRVVIIGDGELRADLERQAQALGIAQQIIFTGSRNREDSMRFLSGFDCFVFPSLWEGFGLVLLEAMAFSKAIVASNVSAIPESVIDGKTGILVPPRDPDQLAEALQTLLTNRAVAQAMGSAGHAYLLEQFSVQTMVERTELVYRQLVG